MIKMVVGLGNPGKEYELTRHNIGWLVMDAFSFADELSWREKFKGQYSSYTIGDEKVHFLRPMTYMNLSGESVVPAMQFFKVKAEEILVVHDELDLPHGTIAFKKGGGTAGHNGLKSMASLMGTKDFLRLRIGISRPPFGDVSSWVLSRFSEDQFIDIEKYTLGAARAIEMALKQGFEKAASRYSRKKIVEESVRSK